MNEKTIISAIVLATILAASTVIMALPFENAEASRERRGGDGGDASGGDAEQENEGGDAEQGDFDERGGGDIEFNDAVGGNANNNEATGGAGGDATP
jgi:hypothetical protein